MPEFGVGLLGEPRPLLSFLMADLSRSEKREIEKLLGMESGYVLDFSNRTFDDFVVDSVNRNIFDSRYAIGSGSKANCLRGFWSAEPNSIVGKLLTDLIAHAAKLSITADQELFEACRRIAERLLKDQPVPEIEAINPNSDDRDFESLAKSVREAIEKNQPETGLDRLHTFFVKYLKNVCDRHGIAHSREKPLHSLMGEYVRRMRELGHIESGMTERILKSSISTFESFNDVRNDKSFAHDNAILNYDESLLVFNQVTAMVRFIEALERRIAAKKALAAQSVASFKDDIPF
jgi:hypothetical protein